MSDKTTILFVCTGNACRSQMAEAMLRHLGSEKFVACSAGTNPAGFVHPIALACLDALRIPREGLESKGLGEFLVMEIDAAITLCDNAAQEGCPTFPGRCLKAHWPLPDPSFYPGEPKEQLEYALVVARRLMLKIERLVTLDFDSAPTDQLQAELDSLAV